MKHIGHTFANGTMERNETEGPSTVKITFIFEARITEAKNDLCGQRRQENLEMTIVHSQKPADSSERDLIAAVTDWVGGG